MDVNLVMEPGTPRSRSIRLRSEQTVVGRRRDCGIRVVSREVSRRHCLLSYQNGYLSVEDLDSINGTYVNGQRIAARQMVRPGDRLEIGPAIFLVEYELTQKALDQISQPPASGDDDDEIIEADLVTPEEKELLEVEPVEDDDVPLPVEPVDQEVLKFDDDPDSAKGWQLPEPGQLHELISKMDDPKAEPRRRKN